LSIRTIKLPKDAPGRLAAIGEWRYGMTWRRRLAEGLGISRDTLYWWLRGAAKPHWDIDGELIKLLDRERAAHTERGMEIAAIRKRLMARRKPTC
jgi:DNA-binding XRE family transcriptional regulator